MRFKPRIDIFRNTRIEKPAVAFEDVNPPTRFAGYGHEAIMEARVVGVSREMRPREAVR
jgi:hypothetical protein